MKTTFRLFLVGLALCALENGRAQPPGTELWEFETSNGILSSPAIAADGTIYIGSDDGNLYAINPDGIRNGFCKNLRHVVSGDRQ
jgi:hypothetical protein